MAQMRLRCVRRGVDRGWEGTRDGATSWLEDLHEYDIALSAWTELLDPRSAGVFHSTGPHGYDFGMAASNSKLFVFGGQFGVLSCSSSHLAASAPSASARLWGWPCSHATVRLWSYHALSCCDALPNLSPFLTSPCVPVLDLRIERPSMRWDTGASSGCVWLMHVCGHRVLVQLTRTSSCMSTTSSVLSWTSAHWEPTTVHRRQPARTQRGASLVLATPAMLTGSKVLGRAARRTSAPKAHTTVQQMQRARTQRGASHVPVTLASQTGVRDGWLGRAARRTSAPEAHTTVRRTQDVQTRMAASRALAMMATWTGAWAQCARETRAPTERTTVRRQQRALIHKGASRAFAMSDQSHSCDTDAVCANTAGSFSCVCNSGYDGADGTACSISSCVDNCHVSWLLAWRCLASCHCQAGPADSESKLTLEGCAVQANLSFVSTIDVTVSSLDIARYARAVAAAAEVPLSSVTVGRVIQLNGRRLMVQEASSVQVPTTVEVKAGDSARAAVGIVQNLEKELKERGLTASAISAVSVQTFAPSASSSPRSEAAGGASVGVMAGWIVGGVLLLLAAAMGALRWSTRHGRALAQTDPQQFPEPDPSRFHDLEAEDSVSDIAAVRLSGSDRVQPAPAPAQLPMEPAATVSLLRAHPCASDDS
eukprot:1002839-Rhodomonas_salina.2